MHRLIDRYRRLKQEMNDLLKHDAPFVVGLCLFPAIANEALLARKKLRFTAMTSRHSGV